MTGTTGAVSVAVLRCVPLSLDKREGRACREKAEVGINWKERRSNGKCPDAGSSLSGTLIPWRENPTTARSRDGTKEQIVGFRTHGLSL
mmetsp:Transcript_55223/g.108021  ORF Transcript_55223/g.108021 Transcript_55223/m.108021 type:complete len:89 (+) Transcript_55223:1149-1415(+)